MAEFLEKQTVPSIACRCTIAVCGQMHAPTLASDSDHPLYQQAGYVINCPEFKTIIGYFDRAVDEYRSVFAADPHGGHRIAGPRQPRRAPIDCEIGHAGCRGEGARTCVRRACKSCCTKSRTYCKTHDAPRRPAAAPRPRGHGHLTLQLSVRDQNKTHFADIVVPTDVFHLALLEREQFAALGFDAVDAKSLEYYHFGELKWCPLNHQTAIHLPPATRTLLLRAKSRLQPFPPQFVCDFSDGYDQFCAFIGPDTSEAIAFAKAFPDYRFDAQQFREALDVWSATPHDVQTIFKDAGRADAGRWVDLVKDVDHRKRILAAQRRRSAAPPAIARPAKQEVIEIDDD